MPNKTNAQVALECASLVRQGTESYKEQGTATTLKFAEEFLRWLETHTPTDLSK